MKLLVALCTILAVGQAVSYSDLLRQEWNTYKVRHSKTYLNPKEEQLRMKMFMETKERIAQHNAAFERGEVTYKMGLNMFADMTDDEAANWVSGLRPSGIRKIGGQNFTRDHSIKLPSSVDWRNKGAVNPVKNQGSCGSCWAFSATGAIEGHYFIKTGQLVSLSEQNLMDCSTSYGNLGCSGGLMTDAFRYIIDNGGIDTEDSYPYEEYDSYCRFNVKNIGAKISSYVEIPTGDQQALKEAVAKGPVSVAMYASERSFNSYASGIYYDTKCSSSIRSMNHGVLAVGYGNEDGTDYWIVKNSWGKNWGEDGYFRISFKDNNCGIATMASYPVV